MPVSVLAAKSASLMAVSLQARFFTAVHDQLVDLDRHIAAALDAAEAYSIANRLLQT